MGEKGSSRLSRSSEEMIDQVRSCVATGRTGERIGETESRLGSERSEGVDSATGDDDRGADPVCPSEASRSTLKLLRRWRSAAASTSAASLPGPPTTPAHASSTSSSGASGIGLRPLNSIQRAMSW